MTRWAVVLAGGVGSRFWPLSTNERPKQLLPLVATKPLLVEQLERIRALADVRQTLVLHANVVERSSYRHPWLGLAFALALLIPSTWLVAVKYIHVPEVLLVRGQGLAVLFGLVFGLWGLYEILAAPRVTTLRIEDDGRARELALPGATRAEAEEFVAELRRTLGSP